MQHCSGTVLNRMNRRGDRESLSALVKKLREKIPGIVIRTTLMTGFPGETVKVFEELSDFAECGLCGTAAVISPVGQIDDHGRSICFPSGMDEMGPTIRRLYDTLTGIQLGLLDGPEGWVHEITV